MRAAKSVADALDGAIFVQENVPETLEAKLAIFAELDALAAPDAILASSTSAIVAQPFTENLKGRARCLVAHPVNPPHLVPIVELVGAPWTSPEIIARARRLYESIGQVPIVVQQGDRRLHPQPPAGRVARRGVSSGRRGLCLAAGSRQDHQGRPRPALVVHGPFADHRTECARRHRRLLRALYRLLQAAAGEAGWMSRCSRIQTSPSILQRVGQAGDGRASSPSSRAGATSALRRWRRIRKLRPHPESV